MDAARQVAPQHSQHLLTKLACGSTYRRAGAELKPIRALYNYGYKGQHIGSKRTNACMVCGPWPDRTPALGPKVAHAHA